MLDFSGKLQAYIEKRIKAALYDFATSQPGVYKDFAVIQGGSVELHEIGNVLSSFEYDFKCLMIALELCKKSVEELKDQLATTQKDLDDKRWIAINN